MTHLSGGRKAYMLRSKLQRLLYGRNGPDQLSLSALWAGMLLWTVYLFTSLLPLYFLALLLMGYSLFRVFSRRVERRRGENARFMALLRPLRRRLSALNCRMRDREHRYFRCPNCGQQMRVPKGKGRIQVTCRSCGITFEEKS